MCKNIGFIGLGKLGLPCAEVVAQEYKVCGYDIYPRESELINICSSIAEVVDHSTWIFIAVPTPHDQGYDGSVPSSHQPPKDFGHDAVEKVLREINQHATQPKNIVLISTVLPGTCAKKFKPLLDEKHTLIYNPYLIAMGSVSWDMVNPEMIIIGSENAGDANKVQELVDIYRPLMQNDPRIATGTWEEAESIKIFYNTFISAKVGLVNMIQDFAMKIGNINVDVVTQALAESSMRIMGRKYMTAGMGDSGACVLPNFPVRVDNTIITIEELYNNFNKKTHLIESSNYACTAKDEKKIDRVTCREYSGEILKFVDGDTVLLECTPEHLVPVCRSGKRIIIRADEIMETDKLYRLNS